MNPIRPLFALSLFLLTLTGCTPSGTPTVDTGLIPVKMGKLTGYVTPRGETVIPAAYLAGSVFSEELAAVTSGEKTGFFDRTGAMVIAPEFDDATPFSDGLAWVRDDNEIFTIDHDGRQVFTIPEAVEAHNFHDGVARFAIENPDRPGELLYGFVDTRGEIVAPATFTSAGDFSEGMAWVSSPTLSGYIATDGHIAIDGAAYAVGEPFEGGHAVVRSAASDLCGVIDSNGKTIIDPQFSQMYSDGGKRFLILVNGLYGWCDDTGGIIIPARFTTAMPFAGNDLAVVEVNGLYGCIDSEGNTAIEPQFADAAPWFVNNSFLAVRQADLWGFIDRKGRFTVEPVYTDIPMAYSLAAYSGTPHCSVAIPLTTPLSALGILLDRLIP